MRRLNARCAVTMETVVLTLLLISATTAASESVATAIGDDIVVVCPEKCFCSKDGTSVNCEGKKLTAIPEGIPPQVEKLFLDNNLIAGLPAGAFNNLTRLTEVFLRNNKLRDISSKAFRSLPALQDLYLANNYISTLDAEVFAIISTNTPTSINARKQETPAIKYLNLASNDLKKIPDLGHLRQLNILVLNANQITDATFPPSMANLTVLTSIVLSNNKVPELTNDTFKALATAHVTKLEISRNGLKNVSSGALAPLQALQSLKIGYNPLDGTQLQNVLEGLRNVKTLESLDIRMIELGGTLPSLTFSILSGTPLRTLTFRNNRVHTIPQGAFQHLRKLKQLDLSACEIQHVADSAFTDLPELQLLFLNYNRLTEVPNNLPASLLRLYLQGNNIQELKQGMFANLTSLTEMYLTDNKMHQVDKDSFLNLRSLKILHLNNNKLSYIPNDLFGPLTSLQKLLLRNNNLKTLKGSDKAMYSLVSLITLDMSGNQCSFMPLDYLSQLTSLQTLDLDNNNLKGLFDSDTGGMLLGNLRKLQHLCLANNNLVYIHDAQFRNLFKLEELKLATNQLSSWGPDLFHNTPLTSLDLSYNRIALVNETSVRDLSEKAHLKLNLSTNPFACTCDLVWFCDWVNKTSVDLVNVTSLYTCNSPSEWNGKPLLTFCNAHIDCTDYTWYYVGGAIGITFVVVIIITMIIYRQRWFLWLRFYRLQKNLKRSFTRGKAARDGYAPINGANRKFDFYIIASEDDSDWVREVLLPTLENDVMEEEQRAEGDPLPGRFRLYFEDRDAHPGKHRIENFEVNMLASRAVLVVLTDHLHGDRWCHFLLEQAEELKVQGEIDRIQIVKYGRVTRVPRRLQKAMQSNDYREWPDRGNVVQDFVEHLRVNLQRHERNNQPHTEQV